MIYKPLGKTTGRKYIGLVMAAAFLLLLPGVCLAITYATINEIQPCSLTNAIQITVKADGTLDWMPEGFENWHGNEYSGRGGKIAIRFPGARSSMKSFVDVSMYPVSYVQTSVPQDAQDGIGVSMLIGLFTECDYNIHGTPDRQTLIITVNGKLTLETIDRGKSSGASGQKTDLACLYDNGLLSVRALKTDMLKVFGEISQASGINIVVDDAVEKRTVSMSLDHMPPKDVLQAIASAYGLALLCKGDVYMISEGVPTDLATYRLSGTQSFPMKYVKAQAASGLLPTFLYSYLHVNNEQNAVVVSAPSQMLEKIGSDLGKIDIAPPQIMIDVLAIETSSLDDLSLSLGLKGNNSIGQASTDSESGSITYTTIGKLPKEFEAHLKALVVEHKARINANPRMAVVNGQKADIFIGAQRFIRVQYGQEYGQKLERIQGVDVGTKIEVSPWTGGNGEITTTIAPKVSNVVEIDRATGLPTLSSRTASTTVRVKDGETVVIGGLDQQQEYYTSRKIPILGDLPLVGHAFRSKDKNTVDTKLVLLITPRILTDSGHLPEAEEAKIKEQVQF